MRLRPRSARRRRRSVLQADERPTAAQVDGARVDTRSRIHRSERRLVVRSPPLGNSYSRYGIRSYLFILNNMRVNFPYGTTLLQYLERYSIFFECHYNCYSCNPAYMKLTVCSISFSCLMDICFLFVS